MRILFTLTIVIMFLMSFRQQNHQSKITMDNVPLVYNSFLPVYELSKRTIAITVNLSETNELTVFDSIFQEISLTDSIDFSMFGPAINCSYYDTIGEYRLLKSDKLENRIRKILNKSYYIYGTKGVGKFKIKDIIFGVDECRTNILAFTIDPFDTLKYGQPLICSKQLFRLNYGRQYNDIERKISEYSLNQNADYKDNINTKVIANLGSIYFTYDDDFLWGKSPELSKCKFPGRTIFVLYENGLLVNLWNSSLDLFGIPCD